MYASLRIDARGQRGGIRIEQAPLSPLARFDRNIVRMTLDVTGDPRRLLAVFPNNALTDPTSEDQHDASPAALGRAVPFIDEHAHEDIAIADVATAAKVTIRAVQLAFRRHLGTTPTVYLRRVRLDHAHRELTTADPALNSVTAVAYRWGFSSPSRFAAYYRQAYGTHPSQTLHSGT